MSTFTETVVETFHLVSCATCGVRYGIDSRIYHRVVTKAQGSIYCPACGKESCWRESDDQKRIRELEQKLKWEADQAAKLRTDIERKEVRISALKEETNMLERSRAALRGVHTRTCNRVKNGVCPCCNRTFSNLAAHMHTKHPDFKAA